MFASETKVQKIQHVIWCDVVLTHPDLSPEYHTFLIHGEDDDIEIIRQIKKEFENSYYHDMMIYKKAIIDGELYECTIYDDYI